MKNYGMRWVELHDVEEVRKALTQIGSDPGGISRMAAKGITRVIKLEQVPLSAAHILKQEMLSVGGDAAVHRDVIVNRVEATDILLLGSMRQLRALSGKLTAQPFGLKELGRLIKTLLQGLEPKDKRKLDCCGRTLILGERTLIMGILNVTPDSFSDGGKFNDVERALKQATQLIEEGADILDLGAQSTRPGIREISAEEEWLRMAPVLRALVDVVKIPLSIDTYYADVAEKALACGAHMINDVWGLQRDREMAKVAGRYQAPVIVMHNQKGTAYHHLVGDMFTFLRESIRLAEEQGLSGDQIILDPGIGFGKTTAQNLELMARLAEFKSLNHPLLLGASRKSMIGNTLDLPVEERLEGTLATSVLGAAAGVDILRVHDVLSNRRAVQMADAIIRGQRGTGFAGA